MTDCRSIRIPVSVVPSGLRFQPRPTVQAQPLAIRPTPSVTTAPVVSPLSPMDPNTFGGVFGGANFATGLSALVSRPLVSGMPLMGAESAIGVTAPALLTAVALRRGQPLGPTNDQEVEEVIYDAFELLSERTTSKSASKEAVRDCPAQSRTNDSSATSVKSPGRFPR